MKNQLIFCCIFLIKFHLSFGQNITISGKIIDKTNKDPVFGAYILINNEQIGITDDLGRYEFSLATITTNDSICVSHLVYGKNYYAISDFKSSNTIELTSKVNILEEVVVHNGLKDDNITLELSRANYQKNLNTSNYWSGINLKQLTKYKDTAQSYLEVEGHIFMVGDLKKNPFGFGFIIPKEVRRTKESKFLQDVYKENNQKNGLLQNIGREWISVLLDYNFFKLIHPLSKQGKNKFIFKLNGTQWINNNEYYVLEYKQAKRIKLKTRYLKNMYGQIWINKEDNFIFKETTYFDFENLNSSNFTIFYKRIKNKIYPYKMTHNVFKHKSKNINVKSVYEFKNINTEERDNYRKLYGVYDQAAVFKDINYNKQYWSKYNLKDNPFQKDIECLSGKKNLDLMFKEGAESDIYNRNHPVYNYIKSKISDYKKVETILKKDLNLK